MEIQCPTSDAYVLVSGSGSGSGGGTMCVRGIISVSDTECPGDPGDGISMTVRVRVLAGHVPPPPLPPPEPKGPGDVDVLPIGLSWCAYGVPVPVSGPIGAPLTAVAWLRTGDKWSQPLSEGFYVGGPTATDCCAGCVPPPTDRPAPAGAFEVWPPPPPPLPPI